MYELELKTARRDFSRIGIALFTMLIITMVVQYILSALLVCTYGESVLETTWIAFAIGLLPQYLIAMPAAFLIMRRLPKQSIQPEKISFGRFLILLMICYFLMYAGNIVGIGVTTAIELLTKSEMIFFVADLLKGSNLWVNIAAVVILAPVVEELFYRKFIISRMERYGEGAAIIVSGLLFGLIHGNFSQFFYAFALGIALGYIYIRTRKIGVTIALHMLVNLIGGIAAPLAIESSVLVSTLIGMLVLGLAIAGLVMFIIRIRKVTLVPRQGELPHNVWGTYAFGNVGMILFFAASAFMFISNTVLMLV